MTKTFEKTELVTRSDFYEEVAMTLSKSEFIRLFGCEPCDPLDFDYSFDKIIWNESLEFAYNEYLQGLEID